MMSNKNTNMNCEKVQDLFIDYIDGNVNGSMSVEISNHLKECSNCILEFDKFQSLFTKIEKIEDIIPDQSLRINFDLMLNDSKMKIKKSSIKENKFAGILSNVALFRYAAVILIFVSGIFVGTLFKNEKIKTIEIPVARNEMPNTELQIENKHEVFPAQNEKDKSQISNELINLKEEVNSLKSRMIFYMARQSSPIDKIQAVNYVEKMRHPNDKLLETLFNLLNFDKNLNVRLAAFNAISKFKNNSQVKNSLIESLEIQSEPSIQISIINLLATIKEKNAIEPLNKLCEDTKTDKSVKYEANVALRKLRSL